MSSLSIKARSSALMNSRNNRPSIRSASRSVSNSRCNCLWLLPNNFDTAGTCWAVAGRSASGAFGVVTRAKPVNDYDGLVTDHPGVVTLGQGSNIPRPGNEFGAIVHLDSESAGHVILEMRGLAAVGLGNGRDVGGPAPAGFEHKAADLGTANTDNLRSAIRKFADFIGFGKGLMLGLLFVTVHGMLRGECGNELPAGRLAPGFPFKLGHGPLR